MRVIQIRSRNPLLAAIVGLLLLAIVLAVLLAGATLLAGVAVVGAVLGGATLLVRRVLGLGRRPPPALPPLDPSNEVFPGQGEDEGARRRLPPAP